MYNSQMSYLKIYKKVLRPLSKIARRRVLTSMLIQSSLAILDIIGIGFLGLLTYTLTSGNLPSYLESLANLRNISQENIKVAILVSAILFFCLKGVLAPILFKFTAKLISKSGASLSSNLTVNFFKHNLEGVNTNTTQESLYTVGSSAVGIMNVGLGSIIILSSELSLLFLIVVFLALINPLLSLVSLLYFLCVLILLQRVLAKLQVRKSAKLIKANLDAANVFTDIFNNYRELKAGRKFDIYFEEYSHFRREESKASMDMQILNLVPKYIFEVAFFLGAGIIFALLAATENSQTALVQLTLFIASGSRILPSILRVQGALSGLKAVENGLSRVDDLSDLQRNSMRKTREKVANADNSSNIVLDIENLNLKYTEESTWNLSIQHLQVRKGERVAIVGESGSGKSTLVNLILGLQDFDTGSLKIYFDSNEEILYIPQHVSLLNRSILENVALGVEKSEIDSVRACSSLQRVGMLSFVDSLPAGISTLVGERGVFLSGGQIQRIALSRAFYTLPTILILDEATSALDSISENAIANSLNSLPEGLTTIMIAHRLSTIQNADRVIYMRAGKIVAEGTFAEVRMKVPEFEIQASLMGL
jgi:ABC-type bacteriocin/lantibiotic exporter with double-glycine peptidase domain